MYQRIRNKIFIDFKKIISVKNYKNLMQSIIKKTENKNNVVMENWHEEFIVELAKIYRPKTYIELGLYQCVLFNKLIPYSQKLIGVDIDPKSEKFMKKSHKTTFINSLTGNYAKLLKKKPITIDMLFIDADHSQKSVEEDFNNFFPFVADNGLILLHDSYPKNKKYTDSGYCGDGYKTIEKLSHENKAYEMMTIPVHPGLTICRKRIKQLSWE